MKKRIGSMLLAVTLVVSLFTGCGKKATPEALLTDSLKNMQKVKSIEGNMLVDLAASSQGMDVSISMDLDTAAIVKTKEASMKGEMVIGLLGADTKMDLELYTVREDGVMTGYAKLLDQWQKVPVEEDDQDLEETYLDMLETLKESEEDFTLSEKLVQIGGKDCFELKGQVSGEILEEAFGSNELLGDAGMEDVLDVDGMEDVKIPCTYYVYKKEVLPAKIELNMTEAMGAMSGDPEATGQIESALLEVEYTGYDTVTEIKVPEEAKHAA